MGTVPLRQRIRSAIGGIVRRRLMRSRNRFLDNAYQRCEEVQEETLKRILKLNCDSEFSVQYGLDAGLSVAQFQRRFPVSDYETFRPAIDKMLNGHHQALLGKSNKLLMYALTSGTTSKAKHIPITRQFVKDYRRGWQHWGISVHESYPQLKLLKMVQLNSRHEVRRTADGVPCGNISGLVTAMQSPIIRKLYSIPADVTLVEDSACRRILQARYAVEDPWAGMFVTANPSSLISLLNTAEQYAELIIKDIADGTISDHQMPKWLHQKLATRLRPNPERAAELERIFQQYGSFIPRQLWPDVCVLGVWTGGSVAAYLPELQRRFEGLPIRDHGLHASEGRMTIPVCDDSPAGILDVESHFFEFLPEPEPNGSEVMLSGGGQAEVGQNDMEPLQAHQLSEGSCYRILLTTTSGLYRYNIYDIVRCTGFHGTTPLLEFLHKAAHISSITGEKITESQVVAAVSEAVSDIGDNQQDSSSIFTLTPKWAEPPAYELFVSHDLNDTQLHQLAVAADQRLRRINCEYDDKRESGRLGEITCQKLSTNQWNRLNESRLQQSGGSQEQYKHPFLLPDPKFEQRLKRDAGIA